MDKILVLGVNHKYAPVAVRERLAFGKDHIAEALQDIGALVDEDRSCGAETVRGEVVLLSTCNRTEIYMRTTSPGSALKGVQAYLADRAGMRVEEIERLCYSYCGEAGVRHLMNVTAGLDSLVLGESEILGQVKRAWKQAQAVDASGPYLAALFRYAITSGKKVRAETEIGRTGLSVATMVVDLAREVFGDLQNPTALLIGAGKISSMAARALVEAGLECVLVANRTYARAEKLASSLGSGRARAVHFDVLEEHMRIADIVICSTGAPHIVLHHDMVAGAMAERNGRPLLVVDLAVPRDADPKIGELGSVRLADIDDLDELVQRRDPVNAATRAQVAEIVEAGCYDFAIWCAERECAPLIRALHAKAESICREQVALTARKLGDASPETQEALEKMSQAIVAQLLHDPIRYLKLHAEVDADKGYANVVEKLFGLN